jgi:acyl-coenzyme A thioesterase PaaI-like protein
MSIPRLISVLGLENEKVEYSLEVTEKMCDSEKFCHTGVLSALSDFAASSLLFALRGMLGIWFYLWFSVFIYSLLFAMFSFEGNPGTLTDLHTQFMSPVKIGNVITVTSHVCTAELFHTWFYSYLQVIKRGNSLAFLDTSFFVDGKIGM